MRKKMTVGELKRYYENNSVKQALYCTSNQDRGDDGSITLTLVFKQIFVYSNPNTVCLKDGKSIVCFNDVKYVYMDTERTVLGTVVEVVCNGDCEEQTYTIVVM